MGGEGEPAAHRRGAPGVPGRTHAPRRSGAALPGRSVLRGGAGRRRGFAETGASCRKLSDPAVAEETRPPVLWTDPAGAGDRWTAPATRGKRVAVIAAGGARPSGVSTVNRLVWLLPGRCSPGATPPPSPSPGAGSRTLREAVRASSPSPLSARVRPAGCAARARTEHDAGDGHGSAVAEVYRMPEDPVAFLHPGLIPEHDVRRLRPARVRTSPTPDGAA